MISARNICKSYGQLDVLKGVNLDVSKSEIISIVGKSGAGKSTLLHILGTLDHPDKGDLIINETEVHKLDKKALAHFRNKHIGFVFQFHHLLPEFNALENVCMPAYILKTKPELAEERARELLDYLGLKDRMTHKPNELSGGEQQRVAVARALMNSPSLVLADEPTGNLDSATSSELHQLLVKLRDDWKQTFIIVTHNRELAALSDRILEMKDGRFVEN